MSDKVVALREVEKGGAPDEDVIGALGRLLDRARCGEVTGFGFFAVATGPMRITTGWTGSAGWGDMTAGVFALNARMASRTVELIEDASEEE